MKTGFPLLLVLLLYLALAPAGFAADPLGDAAKKAGRPLIADFGMNACQQCIKQSAAMEEFKKISGNLLDTRFVHVAKEGELAGNYKIMLIPTLIFFDRQGKELFRQVGYMPAEGMVAKCKELGFLPR